jgi:hypothetical protein
MVQTDCYRFVLGPPVVDIGTLYTFELEFNLRRYAITVKLLFLFIRARAFGVHVQPLRRVRVARKSRKIILREKKRLARELITNYYN